MKKIATDKGTGKSTSSEPAEVLQIAPIAENCNIDRIQGPSFTILADRRRAHATNTIVATLCLQDIYGIPRKFGRRLARSLQ